MTVAAMSTAVQTIEKTIIKINNVEKHAALLLLLLMLLLLLLAQRLLLLLLGYCCYHHYYYQNGAVNGSAVGIAVWTLCVVCP